MFTSVVPHGGNPETHQNQKNGGFLTSSKSNPLPGNKSRNPATKSGTFHGRKFIESDGNNNPANQNEPATSSRIRGKKMNSSLQDLDKLLDNDAVALLNMKKDLSLAQENEIDKARVTLLGIQKEYDTLKNLNHNKEYELLKYLDEKKSLLSLLQTYQTSIGSYQETIENLNDNIFDIKENILAENRTKNMLNYMISRLEEEILDCKSKSHYWSQQLQQIKAELNGIDGTLRLSKHELTNDEKEIEILSKTIKGRTEQRIQKMNELQSLVMEGEASVVKIKNTWKGGSFYGSPRTFDEAHHSPEVYPTTDIPKGGGGSHEDSELANQHQQEYELTKEQIHEIIERYNTRHPLMEKLNSIQSDLNSQIKEQKNKKINYENLLEKSNQKLQLLASNRQIYQEVDMKDAALTSARKEGDDCREREQRLRKGIEGLRRSIPRFLQKVNKDLIPEGGKPVTVDQLPDVVHKLDDEITKLIKLIGERMLKDATAEDISNMSTSVQEYNNIQTAETTSETSRLHKLPGYHRLEKQLFINLMSAVPDSSEKNIRVQPVRILENNEQQSQPHGAGVGAAAAGDPRNGLMSQGEGDSGLGKRGGGGGGFLMSSTTGNDYIDRNTVKNISKLVVTQREKSFQGANTATGSKYGKRATTLRSR